MASNGRHQWPWLFDKNMCLQSLAWYEDKENAEAGIDENGDRQDHESSLGE